MDVPSVRYARSGEVHLAYCRWGQGDELVLFAPPLMTNAELVWDLPEWSRALRRAGRTAEHVHMDKRGIGLSDRVTVPPTVDDHVADMIAVLDAEGIGRATIAGFSEGGVHALAMAASHPERVKRIVMVGAGAIGVPYTEVEAFVRPDDRPFASGADVAAMIDSIVATWGTDDSATLEWMAPTVAGMTHVRSWQHRFERQSASPGTIAAFFRAMASFDVRRYIDDVHCPVLVAHAHGDLMVHPANGRWYADHLPQAEYWEWPGDDHAWFLAADWEHVQDRLLGFVVGHRPTIGTSRVRTVLFTDIVDSTRHAAAVGDDHWSRLLDVHDHISRRHVQSEGGRIVKSTGDGMLAVFPEPDSALAAALALTAELETSGLSIRAGLHTGQVDERDDGDVSGLAVNIAARVEACSAPGEVLISRTIRDLLMGTTAVTFTPIGARELKGIDGAWELFRATLA